MMRCSGCALPRACPVCAPSLAAPKTSEGTSKRLEPWRQSRWGATRGWDGGTGAQALARLQLPSWPWRSRRPDALAPRPHPSLLPLNLQIRFVLELLERHPQLPLVVVSDSDAVWLRAPWPYFQQRPRPDFFISSDCLSHRLEAEWAPNHGQPRCGHVPGNGL